MTHPAGSHVSTVEFRFFADRVDEGRRIMEGVLTDTRAFPGCLEVTILFDIDDPAAVLLYQVWESHEAEDAYRAWRAGEGLATEFRAAIDGTLHVRRFHRNRPDSPR